MARKTLERQLGFTELPLALSDFLIQSEGINSMRARLMLISVRRFWDGCGDAEAQRLK